MWNGGRMISSSRRLIFSMGMLCRSRGASLGPVVHISTSIEPSKSPASFAARTTSCGSIASVLTKSTRAPDERSRIFSHAAAPRSGLRPKRTTRAPSSANRAAVSSPTPAVPPRMITPQSASALGPISSIPICPATPALVANATPVLTIRARWRSRRRVRGLFCRGTPSIAVPARDCRRTARTRTGTRL
jgi:hypothetical protein